LTTTVLVLRIRFPDGWLLQGTFAVQENLSAVSEFVSEHLETPLPHVLADSVTAQKFRLGEEGTLADLGLVPAALLNFSWDPEIEADLAAAGGLVAFLREDLKAL
jgi:UBX domain-containing protein 6